MRLTAGQLRHLEAELHATAEGVRTVHTGLDPATTMDFRPTSTIARLWALLDLKAVTQGNRDEAP